MKMRRKGVEIYPSLHNWYTFLTGYQGNVEKNRINKQRVIFGIENQEKMLNLPAEPEIFSPCIVHTIAGDNYTHKTEIAISYAAMASKQDETQNKNSFLLVSLDAGGAPDERAAGTGNIELTEFCNLHELNISKSKGILSSLKVTNKMPPEQPISASSYQLWFAPGYIVAEEFVWFVSEVLSLKSEINRVIIHDVGLIPIRHPVLTKQILECGNLFTVLVELFRKSGVDCLFSCTKDTPASRAMAKSLFNISQCNLLTIRNKDKIEFTYCGRFAKNGYIKGSVNNNNGLKLITGTTRSNKFGRYPTAFYRS